MATADALIKMATQCRSAATDDGIEHLAMRPCKVRSVLLPKTVARCANDVGHLEGGPNHRFLRLPSLLFSTEAVIASVSSGLGTASICRRERCR